MEVVFILMDNLIIFNKIITLSIFAVKRYNIIYDLSILILV